MLTSTSPAQADASQAAFYAADLAVQRETWARLEWWSVGRRETMLVAVTIGDDASNDLRQVGVVWAQ